MLPQYSPLYPDLPYKYNDYKRLSVFGQADEDAVRELLPDQLGYVSNEFEAFVLSAPDIEGLPPYYEGGVVVSAGYDDIEGAHMLCEYVNNDAAVAAGREIWGYPKKMATVTFDEDGSTASGTITRNGTNILQLSFSEQDRDLDRPQLFPRLQVKQIPSADGSRYGINQIVKMSFEGDESDFNADDVSQYTTGTASIEFGQSETDPLYKLAPTEITGGTVTTGSFHLGTGEVVADLGNGGMD